MTDMNKFGKKEESQKRPKSAVFGIGGAGRNIISSFNSDKFSNMDIYEVGEENRLKKYSTINLLKKDIEEVLTSDISKKYREKTHSERILENKIQDYDVLYLLCGLGGEMGSCVSKTCSEIGEEKSVFTVALFATPFKTESPSRIEFSQKTRSILDDKTNISVAFSNHKLLKMNPQLSLKKAFDVMNNIISIPMEDLNAVMTKEDIPDLRDFCREVNGFSIGAGYGKGREKGIRALNEALRSPWLENKGFDRIITLITRGEDSSKYDVQDVLESLNDRYPDSKIMYGIRENKLIKKRMRVTVLASRD